MKSFLPSEGTENNGFDSNKDNGNMIRVGDVEINLNLESLQEKGSTEAEGQKIDQDKNIKKEIPRDCLLQREAIFKETIKDPNMLNRPLKKRIPRRTVAAMFTF